MLNDSLINYYFFIQISSNYTYITSECVIELDEDVELKLDLNFLSLFIVIFLVDFLLTDS